MNISDKCDKKEEAHHWVFELVLQVISHDYKRNLFKYKVEDKIRSRPSLSPRKNRVDKNSEIADLHLR